MKHTTTMTWEKFTVTRMKRDIERGKAAHGIRGIDEKYVAELAETYRLGELQDTGDSIKYNGDGTLWDGFNRLTAGIRSGCSLHFWVTRGLTEEACMALDQGKRRGLHHVLAINGENYYCDLSTAIRHTAKYLKAIPAHTRVTNPRGLDFLEKHPGLRSAVKFVSQECELGSMRLMGIGMAGSLFYLQRRKHAAAAKKFWLQLGTGEKLSRRSPVCKFRNILLRNMADEAKLPRAVMWALAVKAWNATIARKDFDRKLSKEDMTARLV